MSAASAIIAPRNYMSEAVAAGFPWEAVIPLVPVHLEPEGAARFVADQLGKIPAAFGHDGWRHLPGWREQGCPENKWRESALAGANAGLRTGVDVDGQGSYVFIDIDPPVGDDEGDDATKKAQEFSDLVVAVLVEKFGPLWVRRSRPGRAGVMFRVRSDGDPGSKVAHQFEDDGFTKAAKIEYLAAGQQVAFGGVHVSGHDISWYRTDTRAVRSFPPAAELVTVESSAAVHDALATVCDTMTMYGMAVHQGRSRLAAGSKSDGADPPPSVALLVRLLEALPHDHRVSRDASVNPGANYVSVMLAVAACARAMDVIGDDLDSVRTAAVNWACKWVGPAGETTDWVTESEKWEGDWTQQLSGLGWHYMVKAAASLGVTEFDYDRIEALFLTVITPVPQPAEPEGGGLTISPCVEVWLRSDMAETAREIAGFLGREQLLFDAAGRRSRIEVAGDGRVCIRPVSVDDIPHIAAPICRLVAPNKKGEPRAITIPKDMRSLILSAPAALCNIPSLQGLAAAPILTECGGVRDVRGYDPTTALYALPVPVLAISDHPSRDQAAAALNQLRAALRTFPFADSVVVDDPDLGVPVVDLRQTPGASESAALIALMTAICRASLPLAPGFMITAPAGSGSGAGKGLLARTLAAVAFGVEPRAFTSGHTAEELDKRLAAELLCADPMLLLDNVNATALKSDTLASVITETPTRVRLLGQSKMAMLSTKTFIAVTGNALAPSEDLVRRFLICTLDAKVENPSARPFRDGEAMFLAGVRRRRGELLTAALTIWRWGRQHSDLARGEPLGSFEEWARWCRDPLLALGCQDPVTQIAEARAADPYRMRIEGAFEAWWHAHGNAPVKASDVDGAVREAIDPYGRSRQSLAAKLGQLRGTRIGGWTLESAPGSAARKDGVWYHLRWVGEGEPPTRRPPVTGAASLSLVHGRKAA